MVDRPKIFSVTYHRLRFCRLETLYVVECVWVADAQLLRFLAALEAPCASSAIIRRTTDRPEMRWRIARPRARSAIPTARWCSRRRTSRSRPAGRRSPATSSPRNTSARPALPPGASRCPRTACRSGCGGAHRTRRPKRARAPRTQRMRPTTSRARANAQPRRCSIASPALGHTGAGRPATSTAKRMPALSMTSSSPCWRSRSRRPTRRSGSTLGCIGPMASTARPRVTTTSISSRAR